jgi:hypothetical protein
MHVSYFFKVSKCTFFFQKGNGNLTSCVQFYIWLPQYHGMLIDKLRYYKFKLTRRNGAAWSWSCSSWIYKHLCNQYLSPLKLFKSRSWRGVLDTTLRDKAWRWLAAGRCVSQGPQVSSTNKTDRHDITEISVKVALNTITLIT